MTDHIPIAPSPATTPATQLLVIDPFREETFGQQQEQGWTKNGQRQEPMPSRDATGAGDGTPQPGDLLQPSVAFDAADLWAAYRSGAKASRAHHPVSDELIERSADAYVKLAHLSRPLFDWSKIAVPLANPRPTWEEMRAMAVDTVRCLGGRATAKQVVAHLQERPDRVATSLVACVNGGLLRRYRPAGSREFVYETSAATTDPLAGASVPAVDPSWSTPNTEPAT